MHYPNFNKGLPENEPNSTRQQNLFSCTNRPYIASFGLIGGVHNAVVAHVHNPCIGYPSLESIIRPIITEQKREKTIGNPPWKPYIQP